MAVENEVGGHTAEEYRQRAEEMKHQAQRAETVYLQAIYASIADNWERLAAQMSQAERAHKKDQATENWEKLAGEMHEDDDYEGHLPPASNGGGGKSGGRASAR